jgi:hypothetical protein
VIKVVSFRDYLAKGLAVTKMQMGNFLYHVIMVEGVAVMVSELDISKPIFKDKTEKDVSDAIKDDATQAAINSDAEGKGLGVGFGLVDLPNTTLCLALILICPKEEFEALWAERMIIAMVGKKIARDFEFQHQEEGYA